MTRPYSCYLLLLFMLLRSAFLLTHSLKPLPYLVPMQDTQSRGHSAVPTWHHNPLPILP